MSRLGGRVRFRSPVPAGGPCRVLFLTWRDTTHPDGGGSEVFVERVATRLAAAGHDVRILCAAHANAPRDQTREGVQFHRRGGRLGVYLYGLAYLLLSPGRRADVVIDVQNGLPFFSALVRRRPIVVLLHHVHREQWQIIYPGWPGRLGWWIESSVSPHCYGSRPYVTVSDASRRDLVSLGVADSQITVVHNGVDLPHPDRSVPRRDQPTICVLGRLVPHKQIEHALETAARIRTEVPGLRVEVVGEGWWHEQLVQRAHELGVADITTFHGHVDDQRRDEILDRSWVLLAPSVKEGWGIAIMEAAARGVPAVAYASAGGVCEAISEGDTGRLVADRDELAKATAELLTDHELRDRYGRAARLRASEFDWAASAAEFERVLAAAMR